MATNDPNYMKQYMAARRAKPLQDSLQEPPLQADSLQKPLQEPLQEDSLQPDSLQDVKVSQSSLLQNLLKWSWCYTRELPSKEWVAKHKADCHGLAI